MTISIDQPFATGISRRAVLVQRRRPWISSLDLQAPSGWELGALLILAQAMLLCRDWMIRIHSQGWSKGGSSLFSQNSTPSLALLLVASQSVPPRSPLFHWMV